MHPPGAGQTYALHSQLYFFAIFAFFAVKSTAAFSEQFAEPLGCGAAQLQLEAGAAEMELGAAGGDFGPLDFGPVNEATAVQGDEDLGGQAFGPGGERLAHRQALAVLKLHRRIVAQRGDVQDFADAHKEAGVAGRNQNAVVGLEIGQFGGRGGR